MLKSIFGLTKKQILSLTVEDIGDRDLTMEEVFYMADMQEAHHVYDYQAAAEGRPGLHPLLKSQFHSDEFFVSKILLAQPNIRKIFAHQLVRVYKKQNIPLPDGVAGIPDGATELGRDIAEIMGVRYIEMKKVDGKIVLVDEIPSGFRLLLSEDFCTKGTGFVESVKDIFSKYPQTCFILLELVILNRGGLSLITVRLNDDLEYTFGIAALVTKRIEDWDPDSGKCEPCKYGSKPIKPKDPDHPENWELLKKSQLKPESGLTEEPDH